jgi:hypothetical protein
MDGISLQNKISKVIGTVHATIRPVKFRIVTKTGGNPLLGTGQTLVNVDTLVEPQPVVEYVKEEEVAGGMGLIQLGDYRFTFDGKVTETTLKTAQILYGTDVLKILSFQPAAFDSVTAAWQVLARTVKAV